MILNDVWFLLVGILLVGYAILDGFDLGVGALHLFSRGDHERRILMNSIGPVWDGNEVWLVTAGGALFAAFPHAYATAFSAFYLPFILLLFMLIFRALAIEFRSKEPMGWWRAMWDVSFCVASVMASVLFGVAIGNMAIGIPVGADMQYTGNMLNLLGPYPLLVGLFNLSIFVMHGSIYLHLKTDGDLQRKVKGWVIRAVAFFVIFYVLTTIYTLVAVPSMVENFRAYPWMWAIVVLNVLAIANIPRSIFHERPFNAFLSSCAAIAALIGLFGMGVYPNLIRSSLDPAFNMTIFSTASSEKTLGIMLVIALVGMPFVVAYTASIYWIFRGKVHLGEHSY